MASTDQAYPVHDRWILLMVYPAMALLTIHIGNDNSLYALLHIPSYYTDLILALACAYALAFYYRVLFQKIDARFTWTGPLKARVIHHVIYGIAVPVSGVLLIEAAYLVWLLRIPLSQSSIFYLELPIVTIFCVVVNFLYALLYFWRHNLALVQHVADGAEMADPPRAKSNFVVHAGAQSLSIAASDVAYFCLVEKSTMLVTRQGQQYLYDSSLERVTEQVDSEAFFQINRQVVASRGSIKACSPTDTRKLQLVLAPAAPLEVFVSKTRATAFLRWLKRP